MTTQDENTKLRDLLAIMVHIADAMVAVCEHEGLEVDGMTLTMQNKNSGEQVELETSPRKVIEMVRNQLGMESGRIEVSTEPGGES